jgi:hypothetical protein
MIFVLSAVLVPILYLSLGRHSGWWVPMATGTLSYLGARLRKFDGIQLIPLCW